MDEAVSCRRAHGVQGLGFSVKIDEAAVLQAITWRFQTELPGLKWTVVDIPE